MRNEIGLERQDQSVNEINQLMQRWNQRITLRNLRLADRFLNVELHILLHLFIKPGEMWVACFEQERPRIVHPVSGEKTVMVSGQEGTVLVDVIELVNSPERIVPAFCTG